MVKVLTAIAFVAALTSLVLLAVVRGDVLAQQIDASAPVVSFENDSAVASQPASTFYKDTVFLLRLVMALLALAMELGAGIALRDARRLGEESGLDPVQLTAELKEVLQKMVGLLYELTASQNEAAAFGARFWRDFYASMLTRTARKAIAKLSLLMLCALDVLAGQSFAAERMNLVVAIDLSKSVAIQGPDGNTEFKKNLDAVTGLLSQIPAGSHVTVIGITGNSFAQPDILLSADVGEDAGYFGERLSNARRQLIHVWRERSAKLQEDSARTDILGAMVLAGQMFEQLSKGRRNVLVIFSDVRQSTRELDIERTGSLNVSATLAKAAAAGLLADLRGVEIQVRGADNAWQSMKYWEQMREFRVEYFKRA